MRGHANLAPMITPSPKGSSRVLLLVLLALCLSASRVCAESSRAVITGGQSVGSFRLGKPFPPYARALGAPTRVRGSDVSDDTRLLYYKKYGMYFLVKKNVVNGITVESPLFATPEGIRVGSSQQSVVAAYGAGQGLRQGELVYPERGLGFTFLDGKTVRIYVMDKQERDLASGDLRIVPGSRVGGLVLGQPVDFVIAQWGTPSKRAPYPERPGAEMWSYEDKGVIVVAWQGKISGMWVFSPAFRTVKDVHVGSRQDDVVRAYGSPKGHEEGIEWYPSSGIGFGVEDGVVKQIYIRESQTR